MLKIIGVGMDPYKHCSPETIESIKSADVNITFDPIGSIISFIESVGGKAENIGYLYPDHFDRKRYYREISEYVVQRAETYQRITYLTYGNPCILDEPVANIVKKSREDGFKLEIYPNVSFLDQILAENLICVNYSGVRMCTARAIIERVASSPSDELLVISQLIELGSLDENKRLTIRPSDLVTLAKRLLETRDNSPAILVQAATTHSRSVSLRATVSTLPFYAGAVTPLTSVILLPP